MKYYWFCSDSRLVREISFEEYGKMTKYGIMNPSKASMIVAITVQKAGVNFRKGNNHLYVPTRQLSTLFPALAELIVKAEKAESKPT